MNKQRSGGDQILVLRHSHAWFLLPRFSRGSGAYHAHWLLWVVSYTPRGWA